MHLYSSMPFDLVFCSWVLVVFVGSLQNRIHFSHCSQLCCHLHFLLHCPHHCHLVLHLHFTLHSLLYYSVLLSFFSHLLLLFPLNHSFRQCHLELSDFPSVLVCLLRVLFHLFPAMWDLCLQNFPRHFQFLYS